jgi:hypothetical protein
VSFDDEFLEVAGLVGVQQTQREVVDDEHVDRGQAQYLGIERVLEAGGSKPGEEFVGAGVNHAVMAADGRVAEGGREVGFADADGSQDEDVAAGVPGRADPGGCL